MKFIYLNCGLNHIFRATMILAQQTTRLYNTTLQDFCKTKSLIKDNFNLVPCSRINGTIHNTLTVKIYSNEELAQGYAFVIVIDTQSLTE